MFSQIRKFFGKPGTGDDTPLSDSSDFFRRLAVMDIFIIAAIEGDGLDPKSFTKEQLLAEIRRSAKELSERKNHKPFVYTVEGQRRLPFFSDMDHAQKFVGEYSKERNRMYPFQLLGVKGSVLAQLSPTADVFIMNDRNNDEKAISPSDIAAIARQ